jgi:biopolymer transport protein ExbB
MFYLLQTDTIQKALGAVTASAPEKISMLSLLEKGGWICIPYIFY